MEVASNTIGDCLETHISGPVERNYARILVVTGTLLVAVAGYLKPGTFLNSISAELFGIVIVAVVVDLVNERKQEKERKQILRAMFGSSRRDVAEVALIELRNRQWLYDGSLQGADLSNADLVGANLYNANLDNCNLNGTLLMDADLSGVKLRNGSLFRTRLNNAHLPNAELAGSNLFGAHLEHALMLSTDLKAASLTRANLSEVILLDSDLEQADFSDSDLSGAKLTAANLEGAVFKDANMAHADLRRVHNWTIAQIGEASSLERAQLPGVNKRHEDASDTWTIEEWKAQILREHGGTGNTVRNMHGSPVGEDS